MKDKYIEHLLDLGGLKGDIKTYKEFLIQKEKDNKILDDLTPISTEELFFVNENEIVLREDEDMEVIDFEEVMTSVNNRKGSFIVVDGILDEEGSN